MCKKVKDFQSVSALFALVKIPFNLRDWDRQTYRHKKTQEHMTVFFFKSLAERGLGTRKGDKIVFEPTPAERTNLPGIEGFPAVSIRI